ncbi:MAG: RagB/SusD family nutrient uptake outer membrane protein [Tannerella sp.]|jgi:hypothetical protein|nr:RagB/SusD family nutrient uptake outer membrane protein [Tannerella sp.]
MKNLLTTTILTLACLNFSCNDLNIEPVNELNSNQVFTSEFGVESVIITLYSDLPIPAHNASINNIFGDTGMEHALWNNSSILTGEAQNVPLRVSMAPKNLQGHYMSWWSYTPIRYVNTAIRELTNNESAFASTPDKYRHRLGELYFCRAYMYAFMVKCYGGIPIVKDAVSYIGLTDDELYIPRNTEKEVIDFIGEDLDKAIELMGPDEYMTGRANKYVAANLKAKVMLFAACEGKYGTVQLNGLVGIPAEDVTQYYKKAYAAAQLAIDNGGKYELYSKYDDGTAAGKTKNYRNLFIDESADNKERMFIKEFVVTSSHSRVENWSFEMMPNGFTSENNNNGELSVTTEWLELFEDIDGKPFTLNIGTDADPVRYDNTLDLFTKAQPRLRATVLFPGTVVPGREPDVFEVRRGIYESYPGVLHESANFTETYQGMTVQGRCGVGWPNTNGNGCTVWKYIDPAYRGSYWGGSVDWIDMRYAEVLLNKCEAAVNIIGETVNGKIVTLNDALEAINPVRLRAGLPALTDVDEAKVIRERRCELAFENQIFYDLKRWRKYEEILQNKTYHALYPYYVFDEKKYIFKKHERTELRYSFEPKAYYAPIPANAITRNSNLLPNNPGY